MLGHLWLGQPEQLHEVVDGPFPAGEDVQDLPPPGFGHRVERVCGRRCSGHAWESYSDMGMCQAGVPRMRVETRVAARRT